jgi:hypothetical protein
VPARYACRIFDSMKLRINRTGLLGLLCLLLAGTAVAQTTYTSSGRRVTANKRNTREKGFDPQRLIVGGGLGLSFGDVTAVAVSPIIGYRITDHFAAGIGLGFQYYRVKDYFEVNNAVAGNYEYYPLKSTFFYPSVWTRYIIYKNFFAQVEAEYDMQHFKVYKTDSDPASSTYGQPISYKINFNSTAVLVGAGLRQPVTERSSLVLLAMYDLIQDDYSPYLNRIDFRVGFNVGF